MKEQYTARSAKKHISNYLMKNGSVTIPEIFNYLNTVFEDISTTHLSGCLRQLVTLGKIEVQERGVYRYVDNYQDGDLKEYVAKIISGCIEDIYDCMNVNILDLSVENFNSVKDIKKAINKLENVVEKLLDNTMYENVVISNEEQYDEENEEESVGMSLNL